MKMKIFSFFSFSKCFSFSSSEVTAEDAGRGEQILKNIIDAFSYHELKIATNGFCSSNKIGEGGFGSVYKGKLQDGSVVAVKVLSVESKQGDREFMSEIASMANSSHENLVRLRGGCVDGPFRILVYDYMENNSLFQTVLGEEKSRAKFNWIRRREVALGIARALAHIHEEIKPHIVHRDIKASNILLDHNFNPKISDFGLSKLFPDNVTHITTCVAGTLGYLAPEYAVTGHLTRKADVYSFGVLLLEIICGRTSIDFDIKIGEYYLVEKAWQMYNSNELLHLVDPVLNGVLFEKEATRLLKVGLLCVQEKPNIRPRMSTAIEMMKGEINIDDVQISRPGLITDIMHLKVGQKRRSSRSMMTRKRSSQLYAL
ncbi:Protein kinase superfamily protein [Melia azedarach]|uniref:Protein kinase superfamily protein n=1 Tax=Melia azedarach TaxID=155640 RepID=A0ACC1YBJ8_MELAZ|nr:Protein kinase superfamily protein [Melia azedarach]